MGGWRIDEIQASNASSPFSVGRACNSRLMELIGGGRERGYLWQLIKLLSRVWCVEPRVVPQISARRRRREPLIKSDTRRPVSNHYGISRSTSCPFSFFFFFSFIFFFRQVSLKKKEKEKEKDDIFT